MCHVINQGRTPHGYNKYGTVHTPVKYVHRSALLYSLEYSVAFTYFYLLERTQGFVCMYVDLLSLLIYSFV